MKVGILTYHFSDNYGALFQAYALRQWFLNQGFEAEFINYHPDHVEAGGEIVLSNFFSKKNLKVLYLKFSKLKKKWFGNSQQDMNFQFFRSKYLGISEPEYKTLSKLENSNPHYDLLVCGSDQIWNPSEQFGLDPVYFLNFKTAIKRVRRISYAPSFGRSEINSKYKKELRTLLNSLDAVSVREVSGVSIVKELIDVEPICVPDPTILLTNYNNMMKPYQTDSTKHVFCYALRSRSKIGDVAETIANEFSCTLYSPYNPHRRWKEIGETVYPCPRQWLYLMHNSEFVVTNSFHGTTLSILLNKPFVVVGLQGSKTNLNTRALNLLELLGLQSRFLMNPTTPLVKNVCSEKIDWCQVNKRLEVLNKIGIDYLNEQIRLVK